MAMDRGRLLALTPTLSQGEREPWGSVLHVGPCGESCHAPQETWRTQLA
jgi:hypothetical protein